MGHALAKFCPVCTAQLEEVRAKTLERQLESHCLEDMQDAWHYMEQKLAYMEQRAMQFHDEVPMWITIPPSMTSVVQVADTSISRLQKKKVKAFSSASKRW